MEPETSNKNWSQNMQHQRLEREMQQKQQKNK